MVLHLHDLFTHTQVGLLEHLDAVGGDIADDADGQAGAGEGLAVDDVAGQSELAADFADLILEELAQGFDQIELEVLGESTDIVVALDRGRGAADGRDRFDDIGVERALGEEFDAVTKGAGLVGEDIDEGRPDDLALLLGIGDAGEFVEKELAGAGDGEVDAKGIAEELLDFFGLAVAHQAIVDVDAVELVADGLVQQGGHDRGVDAATQSEQHMVVPDLCADFADGILDELGHLPVAGTTAHLEGEVPEDLAPLRGVDDFGMELHTEDPAVQVLHGGEGAVVGLGDRDEPGRERGDLVTMAHPYLQVGIESGKEGGVLGHVHHGLAILAFEAGLHRAAQRVGGELHAVADAEDRDAQLEKGGIALGGVGIRHAAGAAGENDAPRVALLEFVGRGVEADDLAVDLLLAQAAGDQLGDLGTVVEDGDPFGMMHSMGLFNKVMTATR